VRKTIRRSMFLTATAGLALLGLGLGQASAAVPTLPALPPAPGVPTLPTVESPLSSLSNLANLDDQADLDAQDAERAGLPRTSGLPLVGGLPLLGDLTNKLGLEKLLGGLGGLTGQGGAGGLTNAAGGLGGLTGAGRSGLPVGKGLPSLSDAPALGKISEVPSLMDLLFTLGGLTGVGNTPGMPSTLPTEGAQLPSAETGEMNLPSAKPQMIQTPTGQVPVTSKKKLPVAPVTDPGNALDKLLSTTNAADVQGLNKPQVPDLSSAPAPGDLLASAPALAGLDGVALPDTSDVEGTVQDVEGLVGGTDLLTDVTELTAV
jgi:hypothetical protein